MSIIIKIRIIPLILSILTLSSCVQNVHHPEMIYTPGKYKSLSISNIFPATNPTMAKTYSSTANYYYSLNLAETVPSTITHSITVADPQAQGYTIYWSIDGVAISSNDNKTSLKVDYTLFGSDTNSRIGLHTVTVKLGDSYGIEIESQTWVINIENNV
ncbi:MAG: hypothetical protein HQK49_14970 [Oligoflexia bacterium]|nr:hypothetical protein [Oligoflexia bacterium]